jgi:hypothetical protein
VPRRDTQGARETLSQDAAMRSTRRDQAWRLRPRRLAWARGVGHEIAQRRPVSWPIADITGIGIAATARATPRC